MLLVLLLYLVPQWLQPLATLPSQLVLPLLLSPVSMLVLTTHLLPIPVHIHLLSLMSMLRFPPSLMLMSRSLQSPTFMRRSQLSSTLMFRSQLNLMLMSRSRLSHTSTLSQLLPPSLMLPLQLLMLLPQLVMLLPQLLMLLLQLLPLSLMLLLLHMLLLPLMPDTPLLPLTMVMPLPPLLLDTLVSLLLLDMLTKQLPLQQTYGAQTTRNAIMMLPHRTSHVSLCFVDFCCASFYSTNIY